MYHENIHVSVSMKTEAWKCVHSYVWAQRAQGTRPALTPVWALTTHVSGSSSQRPQAQPSGGARGEEGHSAGIPRLAPASASSEAHGQEGQWGQGGFLAPPLLCWETLAWCPVPSLASPL